MMFSHSILLLLLYDRSQHCKMHLPKFCCPNSDAQALVFHCPCVRKGFWEELDSPEPQQSRLPANRYMEKGQTCSPGLGLPRV